MCRPCALQALKQKQRCPECLNSIPNLRTAQGRNAWIADMVDSLRNCLNEVGASLTQHAPGIDCWLLSTRSLSLWDDLCVDVHALRSPSPVRLHSSRLVERDLPEYCTVVLKGRRNLQQSSLIARAIGASW